MNLNEELISKKYAISYYLSKGETIEKKKANIERIIEIIKKEINYFTHPLINVSIKRAILEKICDLEIKKTLAYRLIDILISNGRINLLNKIYLKFIEIYLNSNGYTEVDVRAKHQLSELDKSNIDKVFFEITGKKAVINFEKDDSIIGGFILRWDDKIFDLTINNRIKLLNQQIEKEL